MPVSFSLNLPEGEGRQKREREGKGTGRRRQTIERERERVRGPIIGAGNSFFGFGVVAPRIPENAVSDACFHGTNDAAYGMCCLHVRFFFVIINVLIV